MDEIALTFGELDIRAAPLLIRLPEVSFNNQIITNIRKRQLIEAQLEVKVNFDHEISAIVGRFCQRWAIPVCAAQNFKSLAHGNLKFPILLLQNPSRDHDVLDFEVMVRNCPTLFWLSDDF
jgi:hypothetical protein